MATTVIETQLLATVIAAVARGAETSAILTVAAMFAVVETLAHRTVHMFPTGVTATLEVIALAMATAHVGTHGVQTGLAYVARVTETLALQTLAMGVAVVGTLQNGTVDSLVGEFTGTAIVSARAMTTALFGTYVDRTVLLGPASLALTGESLLVAVAMSVAVIHTALLSAVHSSETQVAPALALDTQAQ